MCHGPVVSHMSVAMCTHATETHRQEDLWKHFSWQPVWPQPPSPGEQEELNGSTQGRAAIPVGVPVQQKARQWDSG